MQGTPVRSLVRELDPTCRDEEQRFHEPQLRPYTAKQINIKKKKKKVDSGGPRSLIFTDFT